MENATINNYGDVKIVGNNAVKNHNLNRRKSGMNLHMENKHIHRLRGSMGVVQSGYKDSSRVLKLHQES